MNEFDYSIIGDTTAAAAQATNAILALMQSRRAAQQAREEQRKRDAFNKSMFNRQYYEDAISRSDTQNMLRNYRETMREAIKNQQNTAVVTGETPEAVAATKTMRLATSAARSRTRSESMRRVFGAFFGRSAARVSFGIWRKFSKSSDALLRPDQSARMRQPRPRMFSMASLPILRRSAWMRYSTALPSGSSPGA